jgi:nitroreductase
MADRERITLELTPDELLSTTRAVRRRLDFSRPVEREVLEECLRLAQQAPSGSNRQTWHFVLVTEPDKKLGLADLYRRGRAQYRSQPVPEPDPRQAAVQARVMSSSDYLAERMQDAPVLLVPCIERRGPNPSSAALAGMYGSILPAVWSFMLAARARGLGTCLTTLHLNHEAEAAALLGIPYEQVLQVALIPVAYTLGTDFKPGPRLPLESMVHWEGW